MPDAAVLKIIEQAKQAGWLYFDASLYFAHWQVVEVAFRLTRNAVDLQTISAVPGRAVAGCSFGWINCRRYILRRTRRFHAEADGRGWLSSLVGMRAELVSGDERRPVSRMAARRTAWGG